MKNYHEKYIERCLELAWAARKKNNHPFGALLVYNGEILLEAENQVQSLNDPTQHAELRLLQLAAQQFSRDTIAKTTLYTSTEPCAMCCGAIYWTGIRKIVYSASAQALGDLTGHQFTIPSLKIFSYGKENVEVLGPILPEKGLQVHQDFWS